MYERNWVCNVIFSVTTIISLTAMVTTASNTISVTVPTNTLLNQLKKNTSMNMQKLKSPLSNTSLDYHNNNNGSGGGEIFLNNSLFSTVIISSTVLQQDTTNLTTNKIINNGFVQATFCVLYTAIFIIGIFGNCLVCYVVCQNKAMHTVTNLFITNLALSDILLCILAVPFTPLYTFLGKWVFGKILCHLVPYAQGVSVYISTLTLTSIAMDRFFVIIYPFHPRMKLITCILIITSIWIIALLLTLPYGLYVTLNNYDEPNANYCEEDWPTEYFRKVFGTITTILQFVVPFLIICICYISVSIKLNKRAKLKPGSKTSRRDELDRDRKRRTNRMLIAMVAVFGTSWLPLNAVNIFNDFYETKNEFYTLLFFISHFIAMASTCYNPFLYAWLNENFRKEFKQVLPCFAQRQNSGRNNQNNDKFLKNTDKYGSTRSNCNGNDDGGGGGVGDNIEVSLMIPTKCTTRTTDIIIPRGPTCHGDSMKNKRYVTESFFTDNDNDNAALQLTVPFIESINNSSSIKNNNNDNNNNSNDNGGNINNNNNNNDNINDNNNNNTNNIHNSNNNNNNNGNNNNKYCSENMPNSNLVKEINFINVPVNDINHQLPASQQFDNIRNSSELPIHQTIVQN